MHEIEYLTIRSGWLILMGTTREVLILSFIDLLLSDSFPNEDEPDETDIRPYPRTNKLLSKLR